MTNPYHDPENGQFTNAPGGSGGGRSSPAAGGSKTGFYVNPKTGPTPAQREYAAKAMFGPSGKPPPRGAGPKSSAVPKRNNISSISSSPPRMAFNVNLKTGLSAAQRESAARAMFGPSGRPPSRGGASKRKK